MVIGYICYVIDYYYLSCTIITIPILYLDFRYYEDPSDQFRGREGTLLPLWTMTFDTAEHLYVTDISWSPDYFDMFAITLGTREL